MIKKGAEGFSEIAQFIRNNAVYGRCGFCWVFFSGEGGVVLAVSHLNLKVLNYQKNPKHLSGSPLSVPVLIIPLRNNRSEG